MTLQPSSSEIIQYTTIRHMPKLDAPVSKDVLTQAEYQAIRDALPTWRDRLIAMVLRNTGLRVSEVLRLVVKECALEGPTSINYVQRAKKRQKTEYDPIYINPGLGVQLRD